MFALGWIAVPGDRIALGCGVALNVCTARYYDTIICAVPIAYKSIIPGYHLRGIMISRFLTPSSQTISVNPSASSKKLSINLSSDDIVPKRRARARARQTINHQIIRLMLFHSRGLGPRTQRARSF
ncbi:hypothetical protein ACLOJK_033149 [Asimina triloba]